MKRIALLVLCSIIASLLLLCLASCTGRTEQQATPEPTAEAAVTDVPSEEPSAAPTEAPTEDPIEDPTEDPFEAPGEEWFIEEAWKTAEMLGTVHEMQLEKDTAEVWTIPTSAIGSAGIIFRESDTGLGFYIELTPDGNGGYKPDLGLSYPAWPEDPEQLSAWSRSLKTDELRAEYQKQLVVAASEIGVSESDDSYYEEAGRCFADKLIELFASAPEGTALHCYDIKLARCEYLPNEEMNYRILLAARAEDPAGMTSYFDGMTFFADDDYPEDIYGWLIFGGRITLTKNEDGSWKGTAVFFNAG